LSEFEIQSLREKSGDTRGNDEPHGHARDVGGIFHDGDRLAGRRSRVRVLLWGISPIRAGFVKINGTKQTKKLFNGKALSETDWTEDSDAKNHPYGHRNVSEQVNDKFIPDRKSGCLYRGFDSPGIDDPSVAGKRVEAVLEFKGQTFDRCQKTAGPERRWKLDFNDDVPGLDKGGGVIG